MRREYDFSRGSGGAVVRPRRGKTRITIRLDDDVLAWFRARAHQAGGGNYQTMINDTLRQAIESGDAPLTRTVRRVVRQELRRTGRRD